MRYVWTNLILDCTIRRLIVLILSSQIISIVIDMKIKHFGFTFYVGDIVFFTWLSKKQTIVTLSTYETEYIATLLCMNCAIWLRNFLYDSNIQVDNKSSIELSKKLVHYGRSKYIDVHYHYIREYIKKKRSSE
jgi:hypothetical protein